MRRATGTSTALVLTLAIVGSAPALAAPGNLGLGSRPAVTVDAAGTAYIAWTGVEPNTTSLHFCRLPRGATQCAARTQISTPGTSLSRPAVLVNGSTVRVLSFRYGEDVGPQGRVYMFTSSDSGANFEAGIPVGSVTFHDAVFHPDGKTVSFATDAVSEGELFQQVTLDPPPGGPVTASANLSTSHLYGGAVGLVDGTTPLVVSSTAAGDGQFRRYNGAGDIHDPVNWTNPVGLGYVAYARLAGGPAGLFLMHESGVAEPMRVRRYDGTAFNAGVALPDGTGEEPQADLAQDPGGRLHAVWPRIDADTTRLHYATSDNGIDWAKGALTSGEPFARARASLAADHIGLVVWDTGAGSTSEVHFMALGPTPPVPPPPPPPTQTGGQLPADYSGRFRPVVVSDSRGTFRFSVPRSCVLPGQRFRVTLKWKRKKRKGNLYVKVRRSDFYLDNRRVRIDKRPPFVHTYRVLVTQPRGSTITLRARAFIKVKRGRSPKKSIRAKLRVCP